MKVMVGPVQLRDERFRFWSVGQVAVFALLINAAGCVTVAPYERETLSRQDMQLDHNPALSESEAHATETREGSRGGFGGGGGGCGCN